MIDMIQFKKRIAEARNIQALCSLRCFYISTCWSFLLMHYSPLQYN